VNRNTVPAQQTSAGDRLVEGAAARARHPVPIMQVLGPIDADSDIYPFLSEERAPRFVDQSPVRLERVRHSQVGGFQPVDHSKRIAIEAYRQNHRFAGVPYYREAISAAPEMGLESRSHTGRPNLGRLRHLRCCGGEVRPNCCPTCGLYMAACELRCVARIRGGARQNPPDPTVRRFVAPRARARPTAHR
jgi:hypothetical protein